MGSAHEAHPHQCHRLRLLQAVYEERAMIVLTKRDKHHPKTHMEVPSGTSFFNQTRIAARIPDPRLECGWRRHCGGGSVLGSLRGPGWILSWKSLLPSSSCVNCRVW